MELEKIQLGDNRGVQPTAPPPSYYYAVVEPGQPQPQVPAYSGAQPGNQGFQPTGFRVNDVAPCEWYYGEQGAGFSLLDNLTDVVIDRVIDLAGGIGLGNNSMCLRQFRVLTTDGKQLLYLEEDTDLLGVEVQRAYCIRAKDSYGQIIFQARRSAQSCPCGFCCACCTPCRAETEVLDANSVKIGNVVQHPTCHFPYLVVQDDSENDVMDVIGGAACCKPTNFYEISMRANGSSKGRITKVGSPFGMKINKYDVKFPTNISGQIKASCIAATILADFRFHEVPRRRGGD